MYTYLRSQEDDGHPISLTASGMLLHPSVDREANESVTIQGHPIRFCTVNLGNEATIIREQLLGLLSDSFRGESHGHI